MSPLKSISTKVLKFKLNNILKVIILATRKTHYTRANPDPNLVVIVDDPDMTVRKSKKEESSADKTPLVKANSCPDEWLFSEDLPFDVQFDLSLFRKKSKGLLNETILDPDFIADLEVSAGQQIHRGIYFEISAIIH